MGDAPPSVKAVLPPLQPGRDDLSASIPGKGIHSLKKTDPKPSPVRVSSLPADSGSSGTTTVAVAATGSMAGGDLTSALAAALLERNKRLEDSDDDEDED